MSGKSPVSNSKKKQSLLRLLKEQLYCELRPSKIHGIGVFAIRSIPKGINPLVTSFRSPEVLLTYKDVKTLPGSVQKLLRIFCYYDKKGMVVPTRALNVVSMAVYLNHSKKPNLQMNSNGSLKSLCRIKKNTELTMDYDHSFGEKHKF